MFPITAPRPARKCESVSGSHQSDAIPTGASFQHPAAYRRGIAWSGTNLLPRLAPSHRKPPSRQPWRATQPPTCSHATFNTNNGTHPHQHRQQSEYVLLHFFLNLLCTTETKGHLYTRQPPFLTVAVEHIILPAGQRHLIPAFIPTFVPAEPLVSILLLTHETLIAHLFSKSFIIRTIVVLCQTDALSDIDFALLTIQNGHIPHVRGTVPSPAIDAFRLKKQLVSL